MPTLKYDIFPAFPLQSGSIECGYASLASLCSGHRTVVIDGYGGIFWDDLRKLLEEALGLAGIQAEWIDFSDYFKDPDDIEKLVSPFLGGNDPLFGTRTNLQFADFFDREKIHAIKTRENSPLNIIYGCGSFLCGLNGLKIFLDLPKNEIQQRSRAGRIRNLGCQTPLDAREMYKRFYFVDWVVLNRHKQEYLHTIDIFGDGQQPGDLRWALGNSIRTSLLTMSRNFFRVRPWFEPGVWGGSWIKEHIRGIDTEVPNYAWSFELISPENGLLFEKDGRLIEISFDWLMFQEGRNVLGESYPRFGTAFPIRFDFLDTFDGGNLSIQCHPRPEYMKEHFNEDFTQEESYYILDTKDNAQVFLGFREDIDAEKFRKALNNSFSTANPLDIEKYVEKHPAAKHDLFLIPYGTIHGSGKNNLVLEISTTPYIFTFKLYDWVRPDLNGKPRPLNISRGMDNLNFDRKGHRVKKELIAKPVLLEKGTDWECWHLPTHLTQLYDVHRYQFKTNMIINNLGKCHVLSLVEGTSIEITTQQGMSQVFNYSETFVIPASTETYSVRNLSEQQAMLVVAFVK